ncbi:hypothetical protein [Gordonia humi]|uniref:Membrane protein YdbS with pleckstrin-like domain n=1 Tax=Gordonia humi TaxID=686429 RepID=A0A840EYT6_9ACTN|nr:hypothetical protein [Gordonia humi]MBB4135478.1 membrane protein YdbS with pleckstrin-like domain [Gordonia humi]
MTENPSVRRPVRSVAIVLLGLVCAYFVIRAVAEPFFLDSYETAWGGPSLVGVLAVHMLPGVVGLGILICMYRRRVWRA